MSRLVAAQISLLVAVTFITYAQAQQNQSALPPSQFDTSDPVGVGFNTGRVTGTVQTMDGQPVNGAFVELRYLGRENRTFHTTSEPNGTFVLYNIPTGSYDLVVNSGADEANQRIDVDPASSNDAITIRFPNSTHGVEPDAGNSSTVSLSQYAVPAKARALYEKAAHSMSSGNLGDSLNKVNQALSICPKFAEALTLRGVLQEKNGQQNQAMADLQKAIQYDPNYPFSYIALAALFNSSGRYRESLPILARAEQLAPNTWQTYFELSRAEIEKGDYDSALRNVDRASQLQGGPAKETPELHLVRGYALIGANEIPAAVRELQAYLARQPNGQLAERAREVLNQLHATTAER